MGADRCTVDRPNEGHWRARGRPSFRPEEIISENIIIHPGTDLTTWGYNTMKLSSSPSGKLFNVNILIE